MAMSGTGLFLVHVVTVWLRAVGADGGTIWWPKNRCLVVGGPPRLLKEWGKGGGGRETKTKGGSLSFP